MSVANTILHQLRCIDPMCLPAWGAKQLMNMGDGLKFKTSGMVKWKGYVLIELDEARDLYNITFGRVRKYEWKVDKKVEGVYADQLVEIIDRQVG